MKKIILCLILLATFFWGSGQTITAQDADKHIGDSVTVCGKIFGGRFFETSKGSPTLLNMGAAFPASPLTIMIPGTVRTAAGFAPEDQFKEKMVCVTGKIVLFKDRPEIIVYDMNQIVVSK